MKSALYIVGAVFEFGGIVGVGSPDLFPCAGRMSQWLVRRFERAVGRFRRLLGQPRHKVIELSATVESSTALRASLVTSVADHATLEEKVAFLLRRDQKAQRDMNEVRRRLADFERETKDNLGSLRSDMESHVRREITAALAEYKPLRILGAFFLAIGLGLMTSGAFV